MIPLNIQSAYSLCGNWARVNARNRFTLNKVKSLCVSLLWGNLIAGKPLHIVVMSKARGYILNEGLIAHLTNESSWSGDKSIVSLFLKSRVKSLEIQAFKICLSS